MKICSISVEPIPSTISTPVRVFQARPISSGSASPAEVHSRRVSPSRLGRSSQTSKELNNVGTPQNIVGLYFWNTSQTALGRALPECRLVVAPTPRGNQRAFAKPYEK